jgi:hypothetical protein
MNNELGIKRTDTNSFFPLGVMMALTPSSAGRKVVCFLWHYSEAPQKARNFLDPLERFVS